MCGRDRAAPAAERTDRRLQSFRDRREFRPGAQRAAAHHDQRPGRVRQQIGRARHGAFVDRHRGCGKGRDRQHRPRFAPGIDRAFQRHRPGTAGDRLGERARDQAGRLLRRADARGEFRDVPQAARAGRGFRADARGRDRSRRRGSAPPAPAPARPSHRRSTAPPPCSARPAPAPRRRPAGGRSPGKRPAPCRPRSARGADGARESGPRPAGRRRTARRYARRAGRRACRCRARSGSRSRLRRWSRIGHSCRGSVAQAAAQFLGVAAFHQRRIAAQHLVAGGLALAPEAQIERVLAEPQIVQSQVRQPGRQLRDRHTAPRAARPARCPSIACTSMKAEPAAQACGTLAPRYCTGKPSAGAPARHRVPAPG